MVPQRGVSLIELMIGIAIVSILLMMGIPSFSLWIQNAQNRTAAESIQNGLQLARVEAVRRNSNVRFGLTDATGLVAWNVGCATVTTDCPANIQSRVAMDGSVNARIGVSTTVPPFVVPANQYGTAIAAGTGLVAGVTFEGMGRIPTGNIGTDVTRIDITNATASNSRRLVVIIGSGGQIRMCDPALALSANPQGCS